MLLRWLVNQYLREGAEGKVRTVVNELIADRRPVAPDPRSPTPDSRDHRSAMVPATADPLAPNPEPQAPAFLPCDAVFIFALGIESGGLVDQLQGAETSRHGHGIERAGKLAAHEIAIVEGGVGQQAAARATVEAIKFYQPRWIISAGFAGGPDRRAAPRAHRDGRRGRLCQRGPPRRRTQARSRVIRSD